MEAESTKESDTAALAAPAASEEADRGLRPSAIDVPKAGEAAEEKGSAGTPSSVPRLGSQTPKLPEGSSTWCYQNTLPRLPIPSLEDTCARFLLTVAPLQQDGDGSAHERTKAAVDFFLGGPGKDLHQRLLDYADEGALDQESTSNTQSYIEAFWDDAYLESRLPLVTNVNPFFVLEDGPVDRGADVRLDQAASLLYSSLKFATACRQGTLEPDLWRGTPLCMHQYRKMFGAARIPQRRRDEVIIDDASRHVAVLTKGRFYSFDVLQEDGSLGLTKRELRHGLQMAVELAESDAADASRANLVGALTSLERDKWAALRSQLEASSSRNRSNLQRIDSAILIVCLDDDKPTTMEEMAQTMLHGVSRVSSQREELGSCVNRWYDKLQLIVCGNGVAGINFEHSVVDGHSCLRFASDIYTDRFVFSRLVMPLTPECL